MLYVTARDWGLAMPIGDVAATPVDTILTAVAAVPSPSPICQDSQVFVDWCITLLNLLLFYPLKISFGAMPTACP